MIEKPGCNKKCLNGGTCVIRNNQFVCICPKGYYGDNCELKIYCKWYISNFFLYINDLKN